MKVTIHSVATKDKEPNIHYFDTYVFEKGITEYDYINLADIVKGCIEDCTGTIIKSIIIE